MTSATRIDVDDAERELASALHDLTCAARDWRTYPNQDVQRCAVRDAFDAASEAFDKHAETLTTWVAGTGEGDRG